MAKHIIAATLVILGTTLLVFANANAQHDIATIRDSNGNRWAVVRHPTPPGHNIQPYIVTGPPGQTPTTTLPIPQSTYTNPLLYPSTPTGTMTINPVTGALEVR